MKDCECPGVVGAAPVVVANPNVGSAEGAARAVCVNCAESCPMAVATAAVLIVLTSTVGAGVAPKLQAVSNKVAASSVNPACRRDFRTNISVPPRNNGNMMLEISTLAYFQHHYTALIWYASQ